jgi:plastocyanin
MFSEPANRFAQTATFAVSSVPALLALHTNLGQPAGESKAPRLAVASPVASPIAAQEMWAIVEIEDFQCVPGTIEIDVGTTIRWKNLDLSAHTATSIESLFNSDRLDRSAGFRFTFETPGSSSYVCQYHKDMAGIVIVN